MTIALRSRAGFAHTDAKVIAAALLGVGKAFGNLFAHEIAAEAHQAQVWILQIAVGGGAAGSFDRHVDAEGEIADLAAALGRRTRAGAGAVGAGLAWPAIFV